MTETQWLASADPFLMLRWVVGRLSDRQIRLLACAACRRIEHFLKDPAITHALAEAERFAEGESTPDKLEAAHQGAAKAQRKQRSKPLLFGYAAVVAASTPWATQMVRDGSPAAALERVVWVQAVEKDPRLTPYSLQRKRPEAFVPMADLVRHIAGNPFADQQRKPKRWPEAVTQPAGALYSGQDCVQALQGALVAARQRELAGHFQQENWHPRGCWALDLILSKDR